MQLVANFTGDRIEFPLTETQASRGPKDRLQHIEWKFVDTVEQTVEVVESAGHKRVNGSIRGSLLIP